MANMHVGYVISQHANCLPSNVLAATYGNHMFSIKLTSDTDNGNLIGVGDWDSLDVFAEDTPTSFTGEIVEKMADGNYLVLVTADTDAVLVYQVPVGAEDWTNEWKKELNLYNKAGDIVRCYGLVKYDRFEVSEAGFDGTPTVGASITGVSNKKLKVG